MPRSSIFRLSLAQTLGLIIASLGGTGIWMLTAIVARPADLGTLGRVVSTATLIAGVLTAGLGQFLLTVVNSTSTHKLHSYVRSSLLLGGTLSAVVAGVVGALEHGLQPQSILAMALLSGGIAITNLQDALYLGTGLGSDVPAKGLVIIATRLVILFGITRISAGLTMLFIAFIASQLGVALVWIVLRGRKAMRAHRLRRPNSSANSGVWGTLGLSYLYAITVATIITGIPSIVTSLVPPQSAGKFYLAWTLASVLASMSIAVANSVLASSSHVSRKFRSLARITGGSLIAMIAAGLAILLTYPVILVHLSKQSIGTEALLPALIVGQITFGLSIIWLAFYRILVLDRTLVVILIAWPTELLGMVSYGLLHDGAIGASFGFLIGNMIAIIPICAVTGMKLFEHTRHTIQVDAGVAA